MPEAEHASIPTAQADSLPPSQPQQPVITAATDSLTVAAADTMAVAEPVETPVVAEVAVEAEPAWMQGLEPQERPRFTGRDEGFVSVVVILLLGLCLNFHTIKRLWGTLTKRLLSTRTREVYEHITSKENRAIGLQLIAAVFFMGLRGNAALACLMPGSFTFTFVTTLKLCGLVTAYVVFDYAMYMLVGYTFISEEGRTLWVEGFTSSMSLLGLALIAPGLVVLFYPDLTFVAIIFSAILFVFAKLTFIIKGFRIFYTNLGSLVYFILYLCSLEIIPLAILWFLANQFCRTD